MLASNMMEDQTTKMVVEMQVPDLMAMVQDRRAESEGRLMLTTAAAGCVPSFFPLLRCSRHLFPGGLSRAGARVKMLRGAWLFVAQLPPGFRLGQLGSPYGWCRTAATSPLLSVVAGLVSCA